MGCKESDTTERLHFHFAQGEGWKEGVGHFCGEGRACLHGQAIFISDLPTVFFPKSTPFFP